MIWHVKGELSSYHGHMQERGVLMTMLIGSMYHDRTEPRSLGYLYLHL